MLECLKSFKVWEGQVSSFKSLDMATFKNQTQGVKNHWLKIYTGKIENNLGILTRRADKRKVYLGKEN